MPTRPDPLERSIKAGFLAWIIPGAGHWVLGLRGFAVVYFVAITLSFWMGVLIGGAKTSVDPRGNFWLFIAELGVGGYSALGYGVANMIPTMGAKEPSPYVSYYPESDVAQIYLAVAGLLNVLAILDALTRAQTNGMPVFYYELGGPHHRSQQAVSAAPPATPQAAAPSSPPPAAGSTPP